MVGEKRRGETEESDQAAIKQRKKGKEAVNAKPSVHLGAPTHDLGWDLIQVQTNAESMKNTILSPLSIVVILGLAAAGAYGKRQVELREKIGIEDPAQLQEAFINLVRSLGANTVEGVLTMANAVVTDGECTLYPEFVEHAKAFDADMQTFKSIPDSTTAINKWIAERTRNMITDMLPIEESVGE